MFYHASILLNWISQKELSNTINLAIESGNDIKQLVFKSFPKNKYEIKNMKLFQKFILLDENNLKKQALSLPYKFEYQNELNFLEFNKKAFQSYRFDLLIKIINGNQFNTYAELWNYICEMKKYLTETGLLVFSLTSKDNNENNSLNYEAFNNFLILKKIKLNSELIEDNGNKISVYLIQKK